jgi:cobaltochelatase CobS
MDTEARRKKNLEATPEDGVQCAIDGVWVHSIPAYLAQTGDMSLEDYRRVYADSPLYSPAMVKALAKHKAGESVTVSSATITALPLPASASTKKTFAEVFELGNAKAAKNISGGHIMIDVLGEQPREVADFIPRVDDRYIFPINELKAVLMAVVLDKPLLLWGLHGTGKTTLIQQFCARTNRPALRVQHTVSTEESHILGQYVVKEGSTVFEPGPLAFAMRFGLCYIADEYDFSLPSVCSVYQPVLEGQDLIIKEAPPEWRVVKRHPNFRFAATGNTNGGGDETGLYQGTQLQNAANYSRFGITVKVDYMSEAQEVAVVASQGRVNESAAHELVAVARHVREAYSQGSIGVTISPRELITAAQIGRSLGGDWRQALQLAYTNRLNTVDKKVVEDAIQRIISVT